MYHPTRGGVRGGRDQFSWDDVKADKHRENYIGHSVKAPVGRWQKGKDLNWYARDKASHSADMEAAKEEIRRIKEQEEQAMREALGLAPKRAARPQGNRLDKQELKELVTRNSTAEDLGGGHADAVRVSGLGHSKIPQPWEESSSLEPAAKGEDSTRDIMEDVAIPIAPPLRNSEKSEQNESEDDRSSKKRRREERKKEKQEKRDKHRSWDYSEDKKHRKHKDKRRHDSD